MKRKPKKYEDDFKLLVVKEVLDQGMTQSFVASRYGIRNQLVSEWVKQYKAGTGWARSMEQLKSDKALLRLQKENKRLRMEIDILKKASAYFARNL